MTTSTRAPYLPFREIQRANFVARPNRFLVDCRLPGGDQVRAYLPNPGRLRELLLPDAILHLVEREPGSTRRTRFTVVAVDRAPGRPIMLHTHRTNDVARFLLEERRVPGLEEARVVAAEVKVGHSRFDFRLEEAGEEILLEVKSCTLVSDRVAMFPDAVTARGARHVRELAELSRGGTRTAVLFVVHWSDVRIFSPDYHTDLDFAKALLESRGDVEIRAVAVGWGPDLSLETSSRLATIPWGTIEREAEDRGSYMVLLEHSEDLDLATGGLGVLRYRAGYYIYVGSAMKGLTKRIERHRRLRKRLHWHVDYLRQHTSFVDALPVRASARLECDLAGAIGKLADWSVADFGSSDCKCNGHLFGFSDDPRQRPEFQRLLLRFRMDRLESLAREEIMEGRP